MSTISSPRALTPYYQGSREGIYHPLNHARREIRVIEILPGTIDQPIRCELHTKSLDAGIRYAALSYVWGDERLTTDILLNGQRFSATRNLVSALWHFRKYGYPTNEQTGEIRWLWVDAVCINQTASTRRISRRRTTKSL